MYNATYVKVPTLLLRGWLLVGGMAPGGVKVDLVIAQPKYNRTQLKSTRVKTRPVKVDLVIAQPKYN